MTLPVRALIALLFFATPLFAQEAPAPAVVVSPAALSDISASVTFNGRLEADRRVDIRARVAGTLLEVGFEPGDMVTEGDVLFRIEDALFQAAVKEAEGALRSAEAELNLAELDRDRQEELFNRDTASRAQLDRAEATLANAEGAVIRAQAALDSARTNLSYTEIKAPFDGRIGVPGPDVGALVSPESGALAVLTRLDPMHAEFSISTAGLRAHLDRVAAGTAANEATASLILANGATYAQKGDLDFIDSAVDGGTDSVRVRARFSNADLTLLDGELVQVVLTSGTPQQVLTVPQRGIQRDLQGAFVLAVTGDSVVEVKRVDVDRIVQGMAVVSAGLAEGDLVIVDGANKVRPGITVDAATEADG